MTATYADKRAAAKARAADPAYQKKCRRIGLAIFAVFACFLGVVVLGIAGMNSPEASCQRDYRALVNRTGISVHLADRDRYMASCMEGH